MVDYGHDLAFGALLEPPADRPQGVLELAELMERVGLDVASLSDHPYWPERLDTFAMLSAIVARTSRVRVMANLANLPLRPPPILARTAAALDILSKGRFDLGVATGAQQMWSSILAEGGPRRTAGESVEALDEAVQIIRALWTSEGPVTFEGRHYRIDGATQGPAPAHGVNIWLGAYQPRMLRLAGRVADGWVPSSPGHPPERFVRTNAIIDEAAVAAGRDPGAIRRAYNIEGEFSDHGTGFIQGPPRMWVEQLTELTLTHGVSVYLVYRVNSEDTLRRFAAEVAPAVREAVASERSR